MALSEKDAATAFAAAWNRLDCRDFLQLLADEARYASHWVNEELEGKDAIAEYLTSKMETIKQSDAPVRAQLGIVRGGLTDGMNCVLLEQELEKKNQSVALFYVRKGQIHRYKLHAAGQFSVELSGIYPISGPSDIGAEETEESERIDKQIEIVKGDITTMALDAIVNAANNGLLNGTGVNGAIHRAAGKGLQEECQTLGGCETGKAVLTDGHNLSAKYVIHTVGPVWEDGCNHEKELLSSCYLECLKIAEEKGFASIAFPALSCGSYGYPIHSAAEVAINTVCDFLEHNNTLRVTFVCFSESAKRVWQHALCFRFADRSNAIVSLETEGLFVIQQDYRPMQPEYLAYQPKRLEITEEQLAEALDIDFNTYLLYSTGIKSIPDSEAKMLHAKIRAEHVRQVNKWVDENEKVYAEDSEIEIVDLCFDTEEMEGECVLSFNGEECPYSFPIHGELPQEITVYLPMFHSPLGAPASYDAVRISREMLDTITKMVIARLMKEKMTATQ
jgi:O-acetyl-ADP-ribose deacetylase (regulator of RNase III)